MKAACRFAHDLKSKNLLKKVSRMQVELYGSLGATGKGHGTDKAVLLGLEGDLPDKLDPETIPDRLDHIRTNHKLNLLKEHEIDYDEKRDLIYYRTKFLSFHPNGMIFLAFGADEKQIFSKTYYSIGGGFIVSEEEIKNPPSTKDEPHVPHPFNSGDELLAHCKKNSISISQVMLENEKAFRSEEEIHNGLDKIWSTMQECVRNGCKNRGILPGGLKVKRRAADLYDKLCTQPESALRDPLTIMDWVNLYAIAVNEENAAGGRVVTAPTNGAAGIIPAVMHYADRFFHHSNPDQTRRFLLTAAAIGSLYQKNASISGADVGCQGEVGVACSMAAAGLAEYMGGTPEQVENAAEIGMEHNLGLTCDPIGGLVQIPCIERNAMGSVKAINASRIALKGDGTHQISLDKVINTMKQTGADMQKKYKETARGGLAVHSGLSVNLIEC
jgi:L-serine dehydratase